MPARKNNDSPENKKLPVNDPSRSVCRHFVKGKCNYKERCRFFHPQKITQPMKKRALKELGKCYCGAVQTTLINKTLWKHSEDEDRPQFFVVCGRTRRSIKRCV